MNKVVLITGGTDGVGRATAELLSPSHTVVILGRGPEKTKKVGLEIGCDFVVCDVTKNDEVKRAVAEVIQKHGRIDCLVNNAGVWLQGELDANDSARIQEVMDVNATGMISMAQAVIPQMKKQREGLIINVISQAGLYGKAERSVYTASKFAVAGLTKSLQFELGKYGIRVTGLYPGKIRTKLFEKVGDHKDFENALEPKEVGRVVEFLLSFNSTTLFPEVGMRNLVE